MVWSQNGIQHGWDDLGVRNSQPWDNEKEPKGFAGLQRVFLGSL